MHLYLIPRAVSRFTGWDKQLTRESWYSYKCMYVNICFIPAIHESVATVFISINEIDSINITLLENKFMRLFPMSDIIRISQKV